MAPTDPVRIEELDADVIVQIQAGLAQPGDEMDLVDAPNATAVTAIQAGLATSAALATVDTDTSKIDDAATSGLAGTNNSLAYRVHEVERHLHSYERWFGAAVVPNAEIHVADRIGTTTAAFQIDAGNNTWGAWVQILGSSDTPADAGNVKYDLHRLMIVDVENANSVHFVQLACGTSGAAALAAGTYTEFVFKPDSVQGEETILDVNDRRQDVGCKAWARTWTVGQDTSTIDFYIGLHEYEG